MWVLVIRQGEGAPSLFGKKRAIFRSHLLQSRGFSCSVLPIYAAFWSFERCVAFCTALSRFVRHLHPFYIIKPQPGGTATPNRLACTRLTLDAGQHRKRTDCQTHGFTNTLFFLASPAKHGHRNTSRALNAREKKIWVSWSAIHKNDTLKCPLKRL